MFPNRTLCDVLREMRECYNSRNFSHLLGLIEEAQTMGNRMEAGLEYGRDINRLHAKTSKLYKEWKELKEKVADAKGETNKDPLDSFEFED